MASIILCVGFAVGTAQAEGEVDWGYEGETGPEHWADLSPDFRLCRYGLNQSPLDIRETLDVDLGSIELDYTTRVTSVVNNGHTLQLNVERGSFMRVEDDQFELLQIHFHSPSEHRIRGESFPVEAHFVHENKAGELAAVAVMFYVGEENKDLKEIGRVASAKIGERVPVDLDLRGMTLLESRDAYFRYSGSLTTPPCSEGIRWFILKETGHISQEQIDRFVKLIGEDARGPQPQGARLVLEH